MNRQTKNNWEELTCLLSKEGESEQERAQRYAALEEEDREIYRALDRVKLDCDYRMARDMKEDVLQAVYHKAFGEQEKTRFGRSGRFYLFLGSVAAGLVLLLGTAYFGLWKAGGEEPEEWIVFTSPNGVSNVVFSDSTVVTLNSGSTVSYSARYNRKVRQVKLEGEAYFRVTPDKEKPFIVSTSQIDIKVLGTVFNLSAYPDDEEITTSLLSGAIELNDKAQRHTYRLSPSEEAVYHKATAAVQLQPFEAEYVVSWTEGKLVFRRKPFHDICRQLEKKFNCRIQVENDRLRQKIFTGKFVHNETLPQILDIIRINVPFQYRMTDNLVTIY